MYLCIFNSFRVLRCLSQCVSPKIAIFTTFFPLGTPLGNHAKCCMDRKRIWCLQIVSQHVPIYLQQFSSYSKYKCQKLPFSRTAAHIFVSLGDAPATITQYVAWMERQVNACQTPRSMYPPIFNSYQLFEPQVQKLAVFTNRSPHFCFPWRRPCGNHAICYMDGKVS